MKPDSSDQPDPLREELVAYLDGELDALATANLERRISDDVDTRQELAGLDRVWTALDELPRATVDDSFTKTTLEMAVMAAQQEIAAQTALLPARRRTRWVATTLAVAASLMVGFIAVRAMSPDPNRELYLNLPVVHAYEAYTLADNVDFLRRLPSELPEWYQDHRTSEVEQATTQLTQLAEDRPLERIRYVDTLDAGAQAELADRFRRYQGATPERRESLSTIAAAIDAAPDAAKLRESMLVYEAWARELPPPERSALQNLEPSKRIAAIAAGDRRMRNQRALDLSPADQQALLDGLKRVETSDAIGQQFDALRTQLPKRIADAMQKLHASQPAVARLMIVPVVERSVAPRPPQLERYFTIVGQELTQGLSSTAQDQLRSMPVGAERLATLSRWIFQATRRRDVSDADLQQFFASEAVSASKRQALLALPRQEMFDELRSMYNARYFQGGDPKNNELGDLFREFWRGGPRPGGGPGGGFGGPFGGRGRDRNGGPPGGRRSGDDGPPGPGFGPSFGFGPPGGSPEPPPETSDDAR